MIRGVIDSTVIVHLFRQDPQAWAWFRTITEPPGVTPITWMEIIYGAGSKLKQEQCKIILAQFAMVYLLPADMDWAMQQLEFYRLSDGATSNDCLIASVCHRLQIPLYAHNLKDMQRLLGSSLVIKPY